MQTKAEGNSRDSPRSPRRVPSAAGSHTCCLSNVRGAPGLRCHLSLRWGPERTPVSPRLASGGIFTLHSTLFALVLDAASMVHGQHPISA